jgi:hypothetical protein
VSSCERVTGHQHGEPTICVNDKLPHRAYCAACTLLVGTAVADLPEVYVELHLALTPSQRTGEPVGGSSDTPLPIRTDARSLAEDLLDALVTWETGLREHLRHGERPPRGREGPTLVGAVRYLAAYLPEAITYSTAQAEHVGQLRRRARLLLGQTRLVHHLRGVPCPNIECGVDALQRENGSDTVRCDSCGRTWRYEEYQRLVVVLASEQKPKTRSHRKSAAEEEQCAN